jgi:hypothetical protein
MDGDPSRKRSPRAVYSFMVRNAQWDDGGMDETIKGDPAPSWNSSAARRMRSEHGQAMRARKMRCLTLPAPTEAELDRMVAAFLARRGGVTRCPTVCVLPVQNGDGPGAVAAPAAVGRDELSESVDLGPEPDSACAP